MFDPSNWQNADTLMLNLMNSLLGLAVPLALAAIAWKLRKECRSGHKAGHSKGNRP